MAKRLFSLFLLLTLLLLPACSENSNEIKGGAESFRAFNAVCSITCSDDKKDDYVAFLEALSEKWDAKNTESEIAILNNSRSNDHLSAETKELILKALELWKETDEYCDVSLYPYTRLWGFESDHPKVPNDSMIGLLRSLVGMDTVHADNGLIKMNEYTMLNPAIISNGFAADLLAKRMKEDNESSALISLDRLSFAVGKRNDSTPWQVQLRDPLGKKNEFALVTMPEDHAISSAGIYQNYFEEDGSIYCDIFDPKTGYPVNNDLAYVAVICSEGIRADALSHALLIMGSEKAGEFVGANGNFECLMVLKSGEIRKTDGFQCSVLSKNYEEIFEIKR